MPGLTDEEFEAIRSASIERVERRERERAKGFEQKRYRESLPNVHGKKAQLAAQRRWGWSKQGDD